MNNRNLEQDAAQTAVLSQLGEHDLKRAARERWVAGFKPKKNGKHSGPSLQLMGEILAGQHDDTAGFRHALAEEFLARQKPPEPPCMVNHEMEEGMFFALLDQQRETRFALQRAVALLKTAVQGTPYWGEAEEFLKEADALLERIDPGEMKVWQAGEEPF